MDIDALAERIRGFRRLSARTGADAGTIASGEYGNTVIVGIDGCGGAGKSTLAGALAEHLECQVVHTDDFASWDNPVDWWPRLLQQVLEPLARGEPGRYQRYDWDSRTLTEWHVVDSPILLLEGVTATRLEFRPYLAYSIWIECPAELRLQRGLERDGPEAEPLWREWMAAENRYMAEHRPQEHADIVLNGF